MARIHQVFDWLRARLWFIPAVFSVFALALAVLILRSGWAGWLAQAAGESEVWWLFSGDAGTARDLLSTLLSGIITMTALALSITMVVLSLAAGQLGPRLIWNFIGDRQIQSVIGLFLGTVLYTLIILRSINEELGSGGVPHLAVTLASALAMVCLFALLFHVNKLARSIVSDTIVDQVADQLDAAIAHLPESHGLAPDLNHVESRYPCRHAIGVAGSGYVQFINYPQLCRIAARHDCLVKVNIKPGDFALQGIDYLRVHVRQAVDDETLEDVMRAVVLGSERTPIQDLEYLVRELVEVALRALSPSLNDPFTAVAVINRLATALAGSARRETKAELLRDGDDVIRVIAIRNDFATLADASLNPIRQAARDNVLVLSEMARRLVELVAVTGAREQDALLRHLLILERLIPSFDEPEDRKTLEAILVPAIRRLR